MIINIFIAVLTTIISIAFTVGVIVMIGLATYIGQRTRSFFTGLMCFILYIGVLAATWTVSIYLWSNI